MFNLQYKPQCTLMCPLPMHIPFVMPLPFVIPLKWAPLLPSNNPLASLLITPSPPF